MCGSWEADFACFGSLLGPGSSGVSDTGGGKDRGLQTQSNHLIRLDPSSAFSEDQQDKMIKLAVVDGFVYGLQPYQALMTPVGQPYHVAPLADFSIPSTWITNS